MKGLSELLSVVHMRYLYTSVITISSQKHVKKPGGVKFWELAIYMSKTDTNTRKQVKI